MPFTGESAGHTVLRKHSLFKRLSAGTWPCREWAAFVSCFFFSTLAHTSLLISGVVIPANRYSSSTLVGLKHLVIDLHASFNMRRSIQVPVWKHVEIQPKLGMRIQPRSKTAPMVLF